MKQTLVKFLLLYLLVCVLFTHILSLSGYIFQSYAQAEITQDTVWDEEGSPWRVVGNVTVRSGVTLTIEPDVSVWFDKNAMLIFEGSLNCVGGFNNRVVFTSISYTARLGSGGWWNGLRFVGNSTESFILRNADLEVATDGIVVEGSGKVEIENATIAKNSLSGIRLIGQVNVTIKESVFKSNKIGISSAGNISSGAEIQNNLFLDNTDSICLHATGSGDNCRIVNTKIVGNNITKTGGISPKGGTGIGLFCESGADNKAAEISNVTVFNNAILRHTYGIRFNTTGAGLITDVTVSNNSMAFNDVGIAVSCGSSSLSSVSNMSITYSYVFSNDCGASFLDVYDSGEFDVLFSRNIVSANNGTGVEVLGALRANLTENSIAYNLFGVVVESQGNRAGLNDVYGNLLFGMYVNGSGTIDASENYWGNVTGPFHEILNVLGKGDKINGDWVSLDFSPYRSTPIGVFTMNKRPVAKLSVSGTHIVNVIIGFDATQSSDDGGIIYYFFDFGDGNRTWTYPHIMTHDYSTPGLYNVSLVVMDGLGLLSVNSAFQVLNVTLPMLTVYAILSPPTLFERGNASVRVHVTNGTYGVEGVAVELASDKGGSFDVASGLTDSNGDLNSTFIVPPVSGDVTFTITVHASKDGFSNASKVVLLPVITSRSGFVAPPWVSAIVIVGFLSVIAVFLYWRRRRRRR
jgi:hypothetical protein